MVSNLLRQFSSQGKELKLARAEGGRHMTVTMGKAKEAKPLTAHDIRELEMMLGLSRRKREALGAWLRRHKVPMSPYIREKLVEMDRYLSEWYEVAMVDCEEQYEVVKEKKAGEQGQEHGQEQQEAEGEAAESGGRGEGGAGRGRGRGGGRGRSRAGAGQVLAGPLGPPQVPGPSGTRARSTRGAAAEANRTLDESVDRGEVVEEQCRNKGKKKEPEKKAQTDGARRPSKKKKKRKNLKTRTVKSELVFVRECGAFLETVREERGIPAEEDMVRLAIDGGQGSLKVVANLFNRYFLYMPLYCPLPLHCPLAQAPLKQECIIRTQLL